MEVRTDHAGIAAALDAALAADPVGGTILGSVRASLGDAAWVALGADGLAARSGTVYPVTVVGSWTPAELDELGALLAGLPALAGLSGTPAVVDRLVAASGRPVLRRMANRLFRLDTLVDPVGVGGTARLADRADRARLVEWTLAFVAEAGTPERDIDGFVDRVLESGACWLWCDPAPVSMAMRRAVTFGSARVGPVYTPPDERGRGYGSAVTASATRSILADAAIPVLFTDLANPTSNKIYRALGYRPVEDRVVTLFG